MEAIEPLIGEQIRAIKYLQKCVNSAIEQEYDPDMVASYVAALKNAIEGLNLLGCWSPGKLQVRGADEAMTQAIELAKSYQSQSAKGL